METKGLVIVHTGEGKGKTTAALGMAVRAWGNGMRVLILHFFISGDNVTIQAAPGAGRMESLKPSRHSHLYAPISKFVREDLVFRREEAARRLNIAVLLMRFFKRQQMNSMRTHGI